MSISTACITVRSASESSRIDVSFAIATGVETGVRSTGRPTCSATDGHLRRRGEPFGDQHAGEVLRERQTQRLEPDGGVEAFEKPDLALAEDQHAARPQEVLKPGEGEPCLLAVGVGDLPVEAAPAGEQFDGQAERVGAAVEQAANGDARRCGQLPLRWRDHQYSTLR